MEVKKKSKNSLQKRILGIIEIAIVLTALSATIAAAERIESAPTEKNVAALSADPLATTDKEPAVTAAERSRGDLMLIIEAIASELRYTADEPRSRGLMNRLDSLKQAVEREDRSLESIVSDLDQLTNEVGNLLTFKQSEIGIRHEPNLGRWDGSDNDWLSTQSTQFITIRKQEYIRPGAPTVNGALMASSFVAENDGVNVAIYFSAEAYTSHDDKSIALRALVDGSPVNPANIVFAKGDYRGPRSFIFTTTVDKGIHTAEVQWKVDPGITGYLRDASLFIRTGRTIAVYGTLKTVTAPSGPQQSTTSDNWLDIPYMSSYIYIPDTSVVTTSFSAESYVTNEKAMAVRALLDNEVMAPSDVVFARGAKAQARTMTFGQSDVSPGWHTVRLQWHTEPGGEAFVGDRSLAVGAYPSSDDDPTHSFVAAPSGPSITTDLTGYTAIPNMHTFVEIPQPGNGEIALLFSAEADATNGKSALVRLVVDGVPQADSEVEFTTSDIAHVKSFIFEVKNLVAGTHALELQWKVSGSGGEAFLGDRTLAVASEVGQVPDLAEPLPFGPGTREKEDPITFIDPVVGTRDVLTILFDPQREGHPHGTNTPPDIVLDPELIITKNSVVAKLYGATNSVKDYFRANSHNRFTINNVGVLGWYNANKPADHYWTPHAECGAGGPDVILPPGVVPNDGFNSSHSERWSEALQKADAEFDFSQYDKNSDGVVDPMELAIIILTPQTDNQGSARHRLYAQECPSKVALALDGVVIREASEVFIDGKGAYLSVVAHELAHQMFDLDDMYSGVNAASKAERLSLMSLEERGDDSTPHLDPLQKLALGWITPRMLTTKGKYYLRDIKQDDMVYILPRYNTNKRDEYFVLENRQENLGAGFYDVDIGDSGLAVWHVVEDESDNANPPRGVTQATWDAITSSQSRRGIRLLRPWTQLNPDGSAIYSNSNTLWDSGAYHLLSANCPAPPAPGGIITPAGKNTLTWADCTASGYNLKGFSPSQPLMWFQLTQN